MTDSNRVRLAVVRELVRGTTPTTPRMRIGRMTGESLAYAPVYKPSDEMRSDRNTADSAKVNEQHQGGINVEESFPTDGSPESEYWRSTMYNAWVNAPTFDNDGTADSVVTDAGTVANTYAVVSGGAAVKAGHLVRATGFTNPANNQIFAVASTTATTIVGTALSLTAEAAPPAKARLKVVGFAGASGDITATSTGLSATTLDFTTLGLAVGQWIKIGGSAVGDRFATAACNDWGRITAIAAGALTLDNLPSTWAVDSGAGKTIKVWFGDYIRNGVTETSLTIERGFLAQAAPTYIVQRGMIVNEMNRTFQSEDLVKGSLTFMGMIGSQGTAPLDADPDPATTGSTMGANVAVGRFAEGGQTVVGPNFVRNFTLKIANNLRQQTGLGTVGAVGIGAGQCSVTGTAETYFGSNTLFAKLLNSERTSLSARLTADGQAMLYTLPRVTFTSGSPSASAKNTDVTLPLNFEGSFDPVTGCQVQLDRVEYFEK